MDRTISLDLNFEADLYLLISGIYRAPGLPAGDESGHHAHIESMRVWLPVQPGLPGVRGSCRSIARLRHRGKELSCKPVASQPALEITHLLAADQLERIEATLLEDILSE